MSTVIPFASLPLSQGGVTYAYGPDSQRRPGVVPGTVEHLRIEASDRFPGTMRSVWVHRPAGHRDDEPSAVMVFNDGWWYLDPDGDVRGGIVLDDLAAEGSLPPMIGVFVDPSVVDADSAPTKNRNVEYDAFDDAYASFLLDEVLPLVRTRAAVTAAWCRPDGFGRVISLNPSFAQMPGGNPYPALLATGPRRETRVFLHAAHRDLHWNEPEWNWFAESLETAAALARAQYDVRLVVGDGAHAPNHGGVLLPDALRWLWHRPSE
ncbi:esterase family protein [Curtobacterium sp. 9128]|uniref:alpha/beta hydrolase n=1 Tax=Curtobacterium sp. 9128 TaxID=1793722 RepID=UPI00119FD4B9|nr:enterochelin esterase [Curtobacterium sp. 9128]